MLTAPPGPAAPPSSALVRVSREGSVVPMSGGRIVHNLVKREPRSHPPFIKSEPIEGGPPTTPRKGSTGPPPTPPSSSRKRKAGTPYRARSPTPHSSSVSPRARRSKSITPSPRRRRLSTHGPWETPSFRSGLDKDDAFERAGSSFEEAIEIDSPPSSPTPSQRSTSATGLYTASSRSSRSIRGISEASVASEASNLSFMTATSASLDRDVTPWARQTAFDTSDRRAPRRPRVGDSGSQRSSTPQSAPMVPMPAEMERAAEGIKALIEVWVRDAAELDLTEDEGPTGGDFVKTIWRRAFSTFDTDLVKKVVEDGGICGIDFEAHDVASLIQSASSHVRLHLAAALVDYTTASKAKNTVQRKAEFYASFRISAAQLALLNAGLDRKTALGMISSWAAVITTSSDVLLEEIRGKSPEADLGQVRDLVRRLQAMMEGVVEEAWPETKAA
ncbi:hypothetical protein EHS25_009721 [Saitozyma podzolica]|uniref:Uncharacterized protein n=1 Tax=Saitozyma podzolica TaxID=1890683 RepID=A0A427YJZ9_9TREE|nr:hypothetical protein EHS25_009721 [Saitozyma podzolica]